MDKDLKVRIESALDTLTHAVDERVRDLGQQMELHIGSAAIPELQQNISKVAVELEEYLNTNPSADLPELRACVVQITGALNMLGPHGGGDDPWSEELPGPHGSGDDPSK